MTDRPTERDLALDAIDEAFKQAMVQFTKNEAICDGPSDDGIAQIRRARREMIAKVENWK